MNTTNSGAIAAGSALAAVLATLGIFAIVIGIAWYILQVIAYWKIFTKAGKPGWHSIIPVLNEWDRTDLSWSSTWAWIMIACMILGTVLSSVGTTVNADGETVIGNLVIHPVFRKQFPYFSCLGGTVSNSQYCILWS